MSEVTVAIPVRNGGELFAGVLGALSAQTVTHELLVCDSGSTDGSVQAARTYGARVLEITPERFTHGGARNLLMNEASGEHVAFLTQDAEPADVRWLERLLGGFELAGDVGMVYGPYLPRPDASPAVRMELERWFASLAPDGAPRVDRLKRASECRDLPAVALIGARGFYTDANACVARAAWERAPFREVPYAEDRVLAIDMLRAGYAKAYVPDAAVLHSHAYAPTRELRRCFDEWRGLREVYGWREPASPVHVARKLRGELGLAAARAGPSERVRIRIHIHIRAPRDARRCSPVTMSCASPERCWARAPIGCPQGMRRILSLEGRAASTVTSRRACRTAIDTGQRPQVTDDNDREPKKLNPRSLAQSRSPRARRRRVPRARGLRRRIYLTYHYLGCARCCSARCTFPLRFTPLHRRLSLRTRTRRDQ